MITEWKVPVPLKNRPVGISQAMTSEVHIIMYPKIRTEVYINCNDILQCKVVIEHISMGHAWM